MKIGISIMKNEDRVSAIDVVNVVRAGLKKINTGNVMDILGSIREVMYNYDATVAGDEISIANLDEERASDKTVQAIGHEYGLTLNQVVGFMDTCEVLNNDGLLKDSGVVAVPFWFHKDYVEIKKVNESLIEETDSLMATIASIKNHVPKSDLESLGIELPERKSIITGVQTPYIPGVTGARIGDEHLDKDNIYLGNVNLKGGK